MFDSLIAIKDDRIGLLEGNISTILETIGLIFAILIGLSFFINRRISKSLRNAEKVKEKYELLAEQVDKRVEEVNEAYEQIGIIINSKEFADALTKIDELSHELETSKQKHTKLLSTLKRMDSTIERLQESQTKETLRNLVYESDELASSILIKNSLSDFRSPLPIEKVLHDSRLKPKKSIARSTIDREF